ncbi:MAG TPA: hypothetical protein VI968_03135 [archaeon]|nr:hypothetical protein [archaeon]
MAYVRYKLPEKTHDMLKRMSRKTGLRESELSRIALIEYMRSIGMVSDRVRKKKQLIG